MWGVPVPLEPKLRSDVTTVAGEVSALGEEDLWVYRCFELLGVLEM